MTKKRIGLFVGKLGVGGAERAVSRLSEALSEKYDIYILIYNSGVRHYKVNGKLIEIGGGAGNRPLMAINAALEINKVIRENGIELIISFLDFPNLINGVFNHSCRSITSIRVFYGKGALHSTAERLMYHPLKYAFRHSDAILTLTEKQKAVTSAEMNIDPGRIYVCNNIYDTQEIIHLSEGNQNDDRLRTFIDDHTAVAVGRLADQKNYEHLLTVFQHVHKKEPNAKLLILGEGKKRRLLEKTLKETGLEESVMFAGRVQDPFPYIKASAIYISMSVYEGFPNALVEAMICGLPCVHSDCPTGPAEILDPGGADHPVRKTTKCLYGVLTPVIDSRNCDPSDVYEDIADAWVELLTDRELRREYGERAHMRGMEYDSSKCIGKYEDMIEEVLA